MTRVARWTPGKQRRAHRENCRVQQRFPEAAAESCRAHGWRDRGARGSTGAQTPVPGPGASGFDDEGNQLKSSDLILEKLTEMPKAPEAPAEPMDIIPIAAGAAGLVAVLVGVIILVRRKKKDL